MKIAVAKYPIGQPSSFDAFASKITSFLEDAASMGASVAVLPEYLSLELAATFDATVSSDLPASFAATQSYLPAWHALFSSLSRRLQMTIAAGTFLVACDGAYRNRAFVYSPDGSMLWQDKLKLTGFEKNLHIIHGGTSLGVFSIGSITAGVSVCYDSEFPLPVRAQQEAGARLLLVPSCTDTDAGATRVRVGCLARALENRIFVAQSVTAGLAPWSPALDVNTGEATIYAPMDVGLPADGIVAQTSGDAVWAFADLDFDALEASRLGAQVANDLDWPGQLTSVVKIRPMRDD